MRMLEQATHHLDERARGRDSRFDADTVRRLGLEGVAAGKRELLAALSEGSEQLRTLHDVLTEQGDSRALTGIPIDSQTEDVPPPVGA